MDKDKLHKICDADTMENVIGMIMSNHIDIGMDSGGAVSAKNFVKTGNMLIEYLKVRQKRKPVNGVLPLTDEDLKEFNKFFKNGDIKKVSYEKGCIKIHYKSEFGNYLTSNWRTKVKAILWLAERFQLEVE